MDKDIISITSKDLLQENYILDIKSELKGEIDLEIIKENKPLCVLFI